jgi:hypothetical protein
MTSRHNIADRNQDSEKKKANLLKPAVKVVEVDGIEEIVDNENIEFKKKKKKKRKILKERKKLNERMNLNELEGCD